MAATPPRARRVFCAVVAFAAVLPFLNTLSNGYTLDDRFIVAENPSVHASGSGVGRIFSEPYWTTGGQSLYRPLTVLTYRWNFLVAGRPPWSYHAVNIGLHLIATLLACALFWRLAGEVAAAVAALAFALHPVHTEAVASIVGRAELLAAVGSLVAVGATLSALPSARPGRWIGLAGLGYAAGLFGKESAIVAAPIAVAIMLLSERRHEERRGRILMWLAATFVSIAAAYLAVRWRVLGGMVLGRDYQIRDLENPVARAAVPVRLATAFAVLADYVGLLLFPGTLSADYSYAQVTAASTLAGWRPVVGLAAAAICAGLIAWGCIDAVRRSDEKELSGRVLPALTAGSLVFLLPLAPTGNFLFAVGTIKAERLLYLPSIGFSLWAGLLAAMVLARLERRSAAFHRVGVGLLLALGLLLAARTFVRNRDWRDDLTLMRRTVVTSPRSAKAHYLLGVQLLVLHRPAEAAGELQQATAIYPRYAAAFSDLGLAFDSMGRDEAAERALARALALEPDLAAPRVNLGRLWAKRGDFARAAGAFEQVLRREPDNVVALRNLGIVYGFNMKDPDRSLPYLRRAQALGDDPEVARWIRQLEVERAVRGRAR